MERCANCGKHKKKHRDYSLQCPLPGKRYAGSDLFSYYDGMHWKEKIRKKRVKKVVVPTKDPYAGVEKYF